MAASVFMLAVLVIYVPNQGTFPTSLGVTGINVFNILFALTLIVMILQPAAPRGTTIPRSPLTNVLLTYYAVLVFALAMALFRGSGHSLDDVIAFKNLVSYSLLHFVAYYGVRNAAHVRFLLVLTFLVFVVAGFEAIAQGIGYGLDDFSDQNRASGPFGEGAGNSNFAGVFYAVFSTFALAVGLMGKSFRTRTRLLALTAYAIGCMAIFATFSRQAMLIIGATTLLLALRRNPLLAVLAIIVMLAYPLWAPQGVVERIEMTQQETVSGEEVLERSAASRYELWNGAVQIVKRNPAGIGLNQFNESVEPYLPQWIEARDAQNMYLRFAAEAGVQGLLVFIAVLWAFFKLGLRLRRLQGPPEGQVLGTAFLVSVIAVGLGNIFSSTFAFGEIMANYWILTGLLARYLVLHEQDDPASQPVTSVDEIREVYARWQQKYVGRAAEKSQ